MDAKNERLFNRAKCAIQHMDAITKDGAKELRDVINGKTPTVKKVPDQSSGKSGNQDAKD